ncbi:hypothetical protein KJ365_05785 [Glaciecola sp. XM2]|uniref:hypothetical protein n=1 Tax=Glaciecola sp. XM2 TaxID=1914931 RepID=UPI001BDDD7BA|nr:hypothetical protein [Glaciecola sp. XM2]MBT1450386.1 hypothetical protein [Glaciecola sp. XM2]
MKLNGLFKSSVIAAAVMLAACGGDINISEGDVDNSSVVNNPPAPTTPTTPTTPDPGTPSGPESAFAQGLAVDASADFPTITDKPVYRLAENTTFTEDVTLTSDAHWVLNGRTAVGGDNVDSATLFIDAGTTIFGEAGEDFLVVRRGSQIDAQGTASAPIVFTSVQDVTGQETDIGQWGGLVLLGRAPANSCGDQIGDTTANELDNCGVSAEGDAGQFGGTIEDDNSGTLRYVVVKHAGRTLGNGDELNGISFAGVGSDTTVEYIQVHQNLDDGIEFFGGTVDVKYVVLTDIGDDSLDWSFGWTGKAQFVYIQQSASDGDNAIEADNSEFDAAARPLTKPAIANVTIVGANETNGVRLRAGTAGNLANVLVTGPAGYANCLRVNGDESAANAASGELTITGSIIACEDPSDNFNSQAIGSGDTASWFAGQAGNQVLTPNELGLNADGYTPQVGSILLTSGTNPRDIRTSFDDAQYVGAFDGQTNWTTGWTVAVNGGFPGDVQNAFEQGLATDVSSEFPEITDKPVYRLDENTTFTADVTFTNDAHWALNGRTAVGGDNVDNAVLFIENGTIVFGEEGEDFLVARRGSRIEALGTASSPITMTSVQDVTGQETDIGQWGGLVLLGRAPANSCGDQIGETTAAELENCGVSAEGDAGQFGGTDPEDNSGTLNYVVVKHAGRTLGNGDELNGISFAGVGSGTNVNYIQVHQNLDDGIEFFGGTVNVRHVVLTDIGDDSFDWSFGWTGNAQFVYIVQDASNGDNAFESDNSEFDASATPLTNPTVANVTIQGAAATNGVRLRAGTAGTLKNFLIVGPAGYSNCLRINDAEAQANATAGLLSVTNTFVACDAAENFGNDFTETLFTGEATNRVFASPSDLNLAPDGRTPEATSPVFGAGADLSQDNSYFVATDYVGAFDGTNDWTAGWAFGLDGGIPSDVQNALEQGIATDVSASFPTITDKPVYQLGADTTFTADVSFTNDAHWVLNGRTAVGGDNVDSATLYIQEGTTIFGQEGEDFLVARRGSKIEALGSADAPIVMTSVQDVLGDETAQGQWGGLVLLGRAPANSCGDQIGETTETELNNCGVSAEGDAGQFGGNLSNDDSGTLRYVVVKHAGRTLGNGDELNGISFAGVGSGTVVEYIHVHQNLDDGIEFFGGTVSVKYVVLTDIGDDSFDWSFGWTGNAQFVLIKQDGTGDNAFEADNSEFDAAATPLTNPNIANVTVIGENGANGVRLRAGTAGSLWNFVVTGAAGYANCLRVNDAEAQANATAGLLFVRNSIIACETSNNFGNDFTETFFTDETTNAVLAADALGFATNGYQPTSSSTLLTGGADPSTVDTFFDSVDFVGAMDANNDWTQGWVTVGLDD